MTNLKPEVIQFEQKLMTAVAESRDLAVIEGVSFYRGRPEDADLDRRREVEDREEFFTDLMEGGPAIVDVQIIQTKIRTLICCSREKAIDGNDYRFELTWEDRSESELKSSRLEKYPELLEYPGGYTDENLYWSYGFRALTFQNFVDELEKYLASWKNLNCPPYDGILFYDDTTLCEAWISRPWYAEWTVYRSKVSRELLRNQEQFHARFEEIRTSGEGWTHVRVTGMLERQLLVEFITPGIRSCCLPEEVPVRLTGLEFGKPWFKFED